MFVCLLSKKNYPMMRGDKFIVDMVLQPGLNVYKRGVSDYRRFHLGIKLHIITDVCFHRHQTFNVQSVKQKKEIPVVEVE